MGLLGFTRLAAGFEFQSGWLRLAQVRSGGFAFGLGSTVTRKKCSSFGSLWKLVAGEPPSLPPASAWLRRGGSARQEREVKHIIEIVLPYIGQPSWQNSVGGK